MQHNLFTLSCAVHSRAVYVSLCSEHHMIHTKASGVDVEETLRSMDLLRHRLHQAPVKTTDLFTFVSTTQLHTEHQCTKFHAILL